MRRVVFITLLTFFGCSRSQDDRIVVPKLHAGFYAKALNQINDKLDADPKNELLVDQKLFYCEQLDWPATCISALEKYKDQHGMTNQLVDQYIAYYIRQDENQLLIEVMDQWNNEYDLKKKYNYIYINGLTRLGKTGRATVELRNYLIDHHSLEDLVFASEQYLIMNDTLMSAYNLSKVRKLDIDHELMWEYGNILFKLNYPNKAIEVLDDFTIKNKTNSKKQLAYAKMLNAVGRKNHARGIIKPFVHNKDSIAYLLSDWYRDDLLWDSATFVLKQVINKDSSNNQAFWKLGRLYEDRGWLLTALPYFEHLKEKNPRDTLAEQRIILIERKIAYLQRLKFEENKIPTIELEPKTIRN
ncbi:tetratricopeptide repeat protein [Ekhidna sp.]